MLSITARQLRDKMAAKEDIFLVDVREPNEHEAFNIAGLLIPLNTIFENTSEIPTDRPVVLYCQKGIRSQLAIQRLEQKFNYTNLVNLSGGMDAWKQEIGYTGRQSL